MPVSRYLSIWAIIVLAVVVFAAAEVRSVSFSADYGAIPINIRAAAGTLVDGTFSMDVLRELSRLLTALFLHADAQHILFNMVFLWTFGSLTADSSGQWRALAVFLICGVCGNIVQVWLNPGSPIPIIGASGAVCGFEGVYLGLALRWQLPWAEVWPLAYPVPPLQLGAFALLGFLADMFMLANHGEQIAYGAHLGGFLSGLAIAAMVTTVYPTLAAYEWAGRRKRI